MQKLLIVAIAAAFLATATVPATAESVEARNARYIWSIVGDVDPATEIVLPDGRLATLADAIEIAAARAGTVDLAAIATGQTTDLTATYVGDIWVLEFGRGGCTIIKYLLAPIFVPVHGQLWIYDGWLGEMHTQHGYVTRFIDWTTKQDDTYFNTNGFFLYGISDLWCIEFFGHHFAFPFVDGVAGLN